MDGSLVEAAQSFGAIRYGYQRYQYDVMTVAVILCVILVQIVQTIGDVVSDHIDHHER